MDRAMDVGNRTLDNRTTEQSNNELSKDMAAIARNAEMTELRKDTKENTTEGSRITCF